MKICLRPEPKTKAAPIRCECKACQEKRQPHFFQVVLGPFDSYVDALNAGMPIHAEHESDFGIVVLERNAQNEVVKVVM
jgi:hypothetical protein